MIKVTVPKEISFGAFTYKVYLDETQDDSECSGSILHSKEEIRISPIVPTKRKLSALVHECLHFMAKNYAIELREDVVEALGNGVTELLSRNLGIELDWRDIPLKRAEIVGGQDK